MWGFVEVVEDVEFPGSAHVRARARAHTRGIKSFHFFHIFHKSPNRSFDVECCSAGVLGVDFNNPESQSIKYSFVGVSQVSP